MSGKAGLFSSVLLLSMNAAMVKNENPRLNESPYHHSPISVFQYKTQNKDSMNP